MSMPPMAYVDSSNIEAIGYDEANRELYVQFRNGRTYVYIDVPSELHRELLDADSKGSYFNRAIRPNFEFREL
jgi:KTSC domain